jgi:predicted TPR repeat methyltransferase
VNRGAGHAEPRVKQPYRERQLAAIAARWDQRASDWDRALAHPACHLNDDDAYARFLVEARQCVSRRARYCRTRGLIDAGCGTGLVLAELLPAFDWGIGVDISREMLRVATAKGIAKAGFLAGDCFRLAELCPQAGAVFSRGVLLSHYGRLQGRALLESAVEVLLPGGFLLFDFLNDLGRRNYQHSPEDKTYYTPRQACALASDSGFKTVTILGEAERRVLLLLAKKG